MSRTIQFSKAGRPETLNYVEAAIRNPAASGDESRRTAAIAYVTRGLEDGALKPVIDRTFAFDEMVEAHRYLEQNGQFGKIVVTV